MQEEGQSIEEFIPLYLRRFIYPYHGDFCYTRLFHARLIAQLMSEGFLPIATEGVLLPKLHEHRCVISLPGDLHVSKSVRKKSRKFAVTINKAFDEVVEGCRAQHGSHCWLYPPLVDAFKSIMSAEKVDAVIMEDGRRPTNRTCPVRLYSLEVWNESTGELAGGELGYTVGSIYTSLTGFAAEDSAGSVQLAALGRLLCRIGFSLWDLGMEMEYKKGLGSHLMPRKVFVEHVHAVRESKSSLVLPVGQEPQNAKTIIDYSSVQPDAADSMAKETKQLSISKQQNVKHQPSFNDDNPAPDRKKRRNSDPADNASQQIEVN